MIDREIQKSLRLKYSPDGSSLRKHQLRMLEILKVIDSFCRDNDIKYWLSSGTCLGAVRHGGFIPWDDDVDIEMMRSDFLKFEKLFKETNKYILQTHYNDKYYPTPFHKVREKDTAIYDSLYKYRGIFVDVFCMEYVNDTISVITSNISRIVGKSYSLAKKNKQNQIIFFITSGTFVISKWLYFATISIARFINKFLPNKKLHHTIGVGWSQNIRNEKDIFPLKKIDFEGIELPIPGNSDAYLTRIYGDYMSVPSEDKINPPHVQYFQE